MNVLRLFMIIVMGLTYSDFYSQSSEDPERQDYLNFQTGVLASSYNTLGIRTYFEFQRNIKSNWQYGISYEHSRAFSASYFAKEYSDHVFADLSLLSINGYYQMGDEDLFLTAGLGIGAVHIAWRRYDKMSFTVSAHLTMNIRLINNTYVQFSPLLLFFPNRAYYSPVQIEEFSYLFAATLVPFGIKVKL